MINTDLLTAYIKGFAFLALSDSVMYFAFDDGIVVLPGHVVYHHFGCVVADNWFVIEKPTVSNIGRIGINVTADSNFSTLGDPSIRCCPG